MAGQPGPAPAQHLPHPPEIAGFMIRAYENPLISLMLGRLLNPAISAPGRFDGGSWAMEISVFLLEIFKKLYKVCLLTSCK